MRHVGFMLMIAVAGSVTVAACETDDSLPTRPRTASPFAPGIKAQNDAEHRALEAPAREVPTGSGREFPGQSKGNSAEDEPQVALLDNINPASATAPAPAPPVNTNNDWTH